jgi:hypothetical protein
MRQLRPAAALLAVAAAFAARAESKTTISGKMFVDFSYREHSVAAADTGAGLDLKRFYLTVDHSFNDVWGARFRSDVGDLAIVSVQSKDGDVTAKTGHIDIFIKNAYIEAKLAPELVLRLGSADLPWVPFIEDLYHFRFIELELIDRTGFGTSADWGLHAGGKFGGGVLQYAVSVVNGRGYGDYTRAQAPTVEARVALVPVDGLTFAVGGLIGKRGQNTVGTPTPNRARRLDAAAVWAGHGLRAGVDFFWAKDWDASIIKGGPEDRAWGVSGTLAYDILPPLTVFGRVDHVRPNRDTAPDFKETYFNAGLQVRPAKPVTLALVFKHDEAGPGHTIKVNDAGTLGSTVAGADGKFNEVGLYAQYVF